MDEVVEEEVEVIEESGEESVRESIEAAMAEAEAADTDPGEQVLSDQDVTDGNGEGAEPEIPMPRSWSADKAELWSGIPAGAKEWIASREKEASDALSQKGQELAESSRRWEPYQQLFEQHGVENHETIQQLLGWSDFISQNPQAAIYQLAIQNGVDPRIYSQQGQTVEQPNGATAQTGYNPALAELSTQLNGLRSDWQSFQQTQARAQLEANEKAIEAFASEVDESGNALRPYMQEVEQAMIPIVQRAKQDNPGLSPKELLDKAYNEAVWAVPEVREKILADRESQKLAEAAKAAEEARKKSKSVVGTANTGNAPVEAKSVREELERQFERYSN